MNSNQYNKINELLSEFSAASIALESAEANIKAVQLTAADPLLPEYAQLKMRVADIEQTLREICDQHYEALFPNDKKRSHKTPFGEVKYHKSSALELDDVEKVILKIHLFGKAEEEQALKEKRMPRFTVANLLRKIEEPNLEALGNLDNATLSIFGVVREEKDNFKITPFALKTDKPSRARKSEAQAA